MSFCSEYSVFGAGIPGKGIKWVVERCLKFAESSSRAAKRKTTLLWNALRLQMPPEKQRKRLSEMKLTLIILNRERMLPIFFKANICLILKFDQNVLNQLNGNILWLLVTQLDSSRTLALSVSPSRTCDSPDLSQTAITQSRMTFLQHSLMHTIRMQKGKCRKTWEGRSKKKSS